MKLGDIIKKYRGDDCEMAIPVASPATPLQLTEQEDQLLNDFRMLSDTQKVRVAAYLEGVLDESSNLGTIIRNEAAAIAKKKSDKLPHQRRK